MNKAAQESMTQNCKAFARLQHRLMEAKGAQYRLFSTKEVVKHLKRDRRSEQLWSLLEPELKVEQLLMHPPLVHGPADGWHRLYRTDNNNQIWGMVRTVLDPKPDDGFAGYAEKVQPGSAETMELESRLRTPSSLGFGRLGPSGDDEGPGGSR